MYNCSCVIYYMLPTRRYYAFHLCSTRHTVVRWCASPPSDGPKVMLPTSNPQTDNKCIQEVTVTMQQPIPAKMYYAFAMKSDSCGELGQSFSVNITTYEVAVTFPVDIGQSGLDTREEVYLISWYTHNGTKGPCSFVLMQRTGVLNGI